MVLVPVSSASTGVLYLVLIFTVTSILSILECLIVQGRCSLASCLSFSCIIGLVQINTTTELISPTSWVFKIIFLKFAFCDNFVLWANADYAGSADKTRKFRFRSKNASTLQVPIWSGTGFSTHIRILGTKVCIMISKSCLVKIWNTEDPDPIW